MLKTRRRIAGLSFAVLALGAPGARADEPTGVDGEAVEAPVDERTDFGATFFIGSAIDNFAANDLQQYLNPDASDAGRD